MKQMTDLLTRIKSAFTRETEKNTSDKTYIKDILNLENINESTLQLENMNFGNNNTIEKNTYIQNVFILEKPETQLTDDISAITSSKILPIEKLIDQGYTNRAIDKYKDLIEENVDSMLSNNDKFAIFNGLLSCYVNINDDENVEKYILKIENLGAVKEYYKFLYLQSVHYFNNQDFEKAEFFNDKALAYNKEYLNAILLEILLNLMNNKIQYEDAKNTVVLHSKFTEGTIKEVSQMKATLGVFAIHCSKYSEAITYFNEAKDLVYTPQRELMIGISYYYLACGKKNDEEIIKMGDIDYEALNNAIEIFNKLYKNTDLEIKKILYTQLIPFYFSCLELTQQPKEIIKISSEANAFIDRENDGLLRTKIMAELSLGNYDAETMQHFDKNEQRRFEFLHFYEKGEYPKIVEKLRPLINEEYSNDRHLQYIYLDSLLQIKELTEFIKEYKIIIAKDPSNEPIQILLIVYYEKKSDLPNANRILSEVLVETNAPFVFIFALKYFERNKEEVELGKLLEKITKNKHSFLPHDMSEINKTNFSYLLRNDTLNKVYEFYNSFDTLPVDIPSTKMSIEYFQLRGDVLSMGVEFEKLYELTQNPEYYLNSAICYYRANNLEKVESILLFLGANKLTENSTFYMLCSDLKLLQSDFERAFEHAKKAKEIDESNPNAISHMFYANRSLRCNRIEDLMTYIPNYVTNYPNNGWVKTINIINETENGETKLTEETEKLFKSNNEVYKNIYNAYINHQIGISSYIKYSGTNLSQVFALKDYLKLKMKITTGNIEEVDENTELIGDALLIDAMSFYVLSESNLLSLLDEFKTIYITYSTIAFFQNVLSNNESAVVRDIFEYIKNSINIQYVPIDLNSIIEYENKEAYLEETLHCASYSFVNKIPFLNVDFTLKNELGEKGGNIVNIVAMLRSLKQSSKKTISDTIYKLIERGYMFINFTSQDLYNLAIDITSNEEMHEKFEIYLNMDRNSDYNSYVGVYLNFLSEIKDTFSVEVFLNYAGMIIAYLDNYLNKSKYYFYVLSRKYPEYEKELSSLIKKNTLVNLTLFENISKIQKGNIKLADIIVTDEYEKGKYIISACTSSVHNFLQIFGHNQEEKEFYIEFLKNICKNIKVEDLVKIIEIVEAK